MKQIHVVYRKRPNKRPFQVASFHSRMEADAFVDQRGDRADCYVLTVNNPTKQELGLVRPSVPWITREEDK